MTRQTLCDPSPFHTLVACQNELGECPRWDPVSQQLYWIDILAPAIWSCDSAGGSSRVRSLDEQIGCFSFVAPFAALPTVRFVAAMRSGIWLLNEAGEKLRQLAVNPEPVSRSRFNDGRCDAQGRLWAATLDHEKPNARAAVYSLSGQQLTSQFEGVRTGNGIAFSPDAKWLYYSDTPRYLIYRYAFDVETGTVGAGGVWKQFEEGAGRGRPDGAAVDSEGCYWSTLFDGSRVVRLSPAGELLAEYHLPVQWPTMCAFGGPDLKTLYVTSSRENRSADELARFPRSGDVFALSLEVAGRADFFYQPEG